MKKMTNISFNFSLKIISIEFYCIIPGVKINKLLIMKIVLHLLNI